MDGLPEPQLRQVFDGVRDYILLRDEGPAAVADARAHDANWRPHIFEAFGENLRGVIEEAVALTRRWWWPVGSRREKHPQSHR